MGLATVAYRLLGKGIKAQLAKDAMRPRGFDGLTFAYTGTDGFAYYAWQDTGQMPPVRFQEVENLMLIADRGLSDKNLTELLDAQEGVLMNEVLKAKGDKALSRAVAKAVKLGGEIKARKSEIIPEEVYYNLAAVCVAREDENPGALDRAIHQQKVDMLRQAGRAGADFFTRSPVLSTLLGASLTTEAGFVELLTRWASQERRMSALLKVISTESTSESTRGPSTNSPTGSQGTPATITS